jgi:hypothetical protein
MRMTRKIRRSNVRFRSSNRTCPTEFGRSQIDSFQTFVPVIAVPCGFDAKTLSKAADERTGGTSAKELSC